MEKVENTKVTEAKAQVNKHAAKMDADKLAKYKEQKKLAAKAWKERKDAKAKSDIENAGKLIKFLADKKVTLPEELSKFLDDIANPKAHASGGSSPLFSKLFGNTPKVGDKTTLLEAMQKTMKGKAEIDRYVKIWAEKGAEIKFVPNADMLKATYEIVKLA